MVLHGPVGYRFTYVARVSLPVFLYTYMLWSDGPKPTIGRVQFHAVNFIPANWPLQRPRSKQGNKRLPL